MTVLDCLKPLALSAVGNDNRMLQNNILLTFANAQWGGGGGVGRTLLIVKCPVPGTHCASNAQGLPGRRGDARGWN